jgi:hypothetical protein
MLVILEMLFIIILKFKKVSAPPPPLPVPDSEKLDCGGLK